MSEPAISVQNLSKMYHLGSINRRTLADEIQYGWLKLWGQDPVARMGKVGAKARLRNPEFWALRDVSFDVAPGEIVGIIGRNGAGKSTLLKILTRVTEPTTGRATINGRVGSLLEVGTGFHPELTGRENVYMNGTILGMKKREIDAKFDEIVAFSEIEQFIDTPVKRYSSGMYVRLAFAVAAHLEPEILLVDEVLAVGDTAFQKKCLGKMGDVAKAGRTVLFVSHNMTAVATLCPRALLLSKGGVAADGPNEDVIERYYASMSESSAAERRSGDDCAAFVSARVADVRGETIKSASIHEPFVVEMTYDVLRDGHGIVVPNFHFHTPAGTCCFVANAPERKPAPAGRYVARYRVPAHVMNEGSFSIGVAATSYHGDRYTVNFFEPGLLMVTIVDPKVPDGYNYGFAQTMPGILRPRFDWQVQRAEP